MPKKVRKRGRPKAAAGLLKRKWPFVRAYFPLDEDEILNAACALRNISRAEFVRQAAVEAAKRIVSRDGLGNLG